MLQLDVGSFLWYTGLDKPTISETQRDKEWKPWKAIRNPFMDNSEEVYKGRNDYRARQRQLFLPLGFVGLTKSVPSDHVHETEIPTGSLQDNRRTASTKLANLYNAYKL